MYVGVCFLRDSGWTGAVANIALNLSSDTSYPTSKANRTTT
jgi:hypothetical protein